jgi:two-component system, chemotaxis family, protein-glutamate methylesterase/glutaminase
MPSPQPSGNATRDIIVIGASAGGLEALAAITERLPADFPASIFIAQHLDPHHRTQLAEILGGRSKLQVTLALHGEPIERSHVYVAPPDNHLSVRPGYLHVTRGPKENGHRPSIDVLFRSAAAAYGSRVIGVVLSGYQDCGTSGLLSIKARSGLALVQDPDQARVREMPDSALKHVAVDHVGSSQQIAGRLLELALSPADATPTELPSGVNELEGRVPGRLSEVVCPLCSGSLKETIHNGFQYFRCHVGHAFSLESLAVEQSEYVERALWSAVRALEESATIASRLAHSSAEELRPRFEEKQRSQLQAARLLEGLVRGQPKLTPLEGSASSAPQN